MRDGLLPRFLKFMMTKLLDHGLMIMVVSMAIVHGRLPSYFLLLLDEIGLGFIGDGVEKMVSRIWKLLHRTITITTFNIITTMIYLVEYTTILYISTIFFCKSTLLNHPN